MSTTPDQTLNDGYLRLFGVPLIAFSGLLALMQFYFPGRWDLFWHYFITSVIYVSVTWEICRVLLLWVRRQIPELEYTAKRLLITFVLFLIIAGIGNAVVKLVLLQLGLKPPSLSNKTFFEWWITNFPSILFFVLLLSSIYEAIYFFEQYKIALQKANQLKRQQAQQQLDALKNRVNPHFLFNSLTTLSALIGEDGPQAERFVDELSKVYRYLLRAGRQPSSPLNEELQFAESYSFLLKNRFETGAFSMALPEQGALKSPQQQEPNLPTLTLQNALDYLVHTQNAPLHIRIESDEHQLRIECANQPKSLSFDGSGAQWSQLESQGASLKSNVGTLSILIPFTSDAVQV